VILIIILIENTVWKCCFKRPVSEFFFVFFFRTSSKMTVKHNRGYLK